MARPIRFDEETVIRARKEMRTTKDLRVYRMAQCVVFHADHGFSTNQVANLLNVGRATVSRMRGRFRRFAKGEPLPGDWGGRRNEHMTFEEEREFLANWLDQAEDGSIVVVTPIHQALEKKIGKRLSRSTVYRMLARHDWRKVEPDTQHPKRDPEAQEAYKKTSPRCWKRHVPPM
jgi:transposase